MKYSLLVNNPCSTKGTVKIKIVNDLGGYDIQQFKEAKADDFYDTARLVKSCDLVISVCTTIVHLCGALGVPCWVMTPRHPAWRYQNKGPMPWYKSIRLYRQPVSNQDSWIAVVERIALDLSYLLAEKRAAA